MDFMSWMELFFPVPLVSIPRSLSVASQSAVFVFWRKEKGGTSTTIASNRWVRDRSNSNIQGRKLFTKLCFVFVFVLFFSF